MSKEDQLSCYLTLLILVMNPWFCNVKRINLNYQYIKLNKKTRRASGLGTKGRKFKLIWGKSHKLTILSLEKYMTVFVKRGQWSFIRSLKSVLSILVKHNNLLTQECFFLGNSFTLAVSTRYYNVWLTLGHCIHPSMVTLVLGTKKLPHPLADTTCVFKPYCCRHVNDCIRLKYGAV